MPTEDDQPYRGAERRNGPSLSAYLETRLKLLDEHLDAALAATDLRYQQRFDAQSAALTAAFLSQQTAMQTAFVVAEKAVQAALAAAERAVNKAEVEATERNRGMSEKIDDVGKRIDTLASRFDTLAGQLAGGGQAGKSVKDESRANIMAAVAIAGFLLMVVMRFLGK